MRQITAAHAAPFFAMARERYRIKLRRDAGQKPPWTEDEVFRDWRFCNIFREDDRTTIWFRENVREPLSELARSYAFSKTRELIYLRIIEATVAFRAFNRIETGEIVKDLLLDGWNSDEAHERLKDVRPIVTGAYMIKSPTGLNKLNGILENIDGVFEGLPRLVSLWMFSLEESWKDLKQLPGLGPFTAYEVITDLRWTPVLEHAVDKMHWTNAGPGCAHGLGTILGDRKQFNKNSREEQKEMLDMMRVLLEISQENKNWSADWPPWEMREVEHTLCEYDKYVRAWDGEQLKRRYK